MKTPTVKVNHSTLNTSYTQLHFSIETIKRKMEMNGAKLSHYMGANPFFVLKERDKQGNHRNWFFEPCEELEKLEHDSWK